MINKGQLRSKTAEIYQIQCECGKAYIGQIGRTSEITIHTSKHVNQLWWNISSMRDLRSLLICKGGNYQNRLVIEDIKI